MGVSRAEEPTLGNGDFDGNGRVTLDDFEPLPACLTGPGSGAASEGCGVFDLTPGGSVDLRDVAMFQQVFGRLLNDDCSDPTTITDGFTDFSNSGATTDGPDEPQMCDFFGSAQIFSDLWFCYEATCSGEAVMSLCGSEYDTKMAVYGGCGCPGPIPLACSDDNCSAGTTDSRVTLSVVAGQSYLIRVGGVPGPLGEQGAGTLTVRCGEDPCSPAAGSCTSSNGSGGCDDASCCQAVCAVDAFCCDVTWDSFCAGYTPGLCVGGFDTCTADAGRCWTDTGTPGCNDVECCNAVCAVDPYCCTTVWDDVCAAQIDELCP